MDSSSSLGYVVPPGESLVADKLFGEKTWLKLIEMVFLYGSLTRPPDVRSNAVCSWLLFLLSPHIDSGSLIVDDITVVMRTLEDRYVPRYEQFWLANLHQSLELAIGQRCCDLLMLLSIHLYSEIICAGAAIVTFWSSLEAHTEEELRIFMKQILQFLDTANGIAFERCCFLLVCLYPLKFSWFVPWLSRLQKEGYFSPLWLVFNDKHASSRCVPREGEIWSTRAPFYSDIVFSLGTTPEFLLLFLAEEFKTTDLSILPCFLGMKIDTTVVCISTSQRNYTLESLEEFELFGCNIVVPSMDFSVTFSHDDLLPDTTYYMHLIGKLRSVTCFWIYVGDSFLSWTFKKHMKLFHSLTSMVLLHMFHQSHNMFLGFFYGSSPRPPDVSYSLGFNPLKYTWSSQDHKIFKSKMKVSFHLEGEY